VAAAGLVALGVGACRAPAEMPSPLRIGVPWEVDTLDPHARNSASHFAIASQVYEPLVTADEHMKLRPALARSRETPDASTWVFHLRDDVRFHSGRKLGAGDVVHTLRRLRRGGRGLEMGAYAFHVADVEAIGPLTVRLRTTRPLSVLLNKLRFVMIVPETAAEGELSTRVDGTGPYALAAFEPGQRVLLRRHAEHWAGPAAAEVVEFKFGRDPQRAASDLLAGLADLVQCDSRAALARLAADPGLRTARQPSLFLKYLGFDMARPRTPFVDADSNPFRDLRVRQALHVGIDREAIVAGLDNEAVPAGQPVPPAIFGFNPGIPVPRVDRARARRLLAGSGFPHLRVVMHTRRLMEQGAQRLAEQLHELGLEVELQVLADVDFLERARRRDLSLFASRFGAPTGDASDILDTALHSHDPERLMGLGNYGGYSNPAVDQAIEESAGIDLLDERRAALARVMAMAMEDVAWVPLYVDQDVFAFRSTLDWRPRADGFVLAAEVRRSSVP
jgi:peptide/nickel transport system substrate-binding protein